MLVPRRQRVLKIIVGDYIDTAVPVASETIARRHTLGVSPATIRNDMAELEEEGYILRPHVSAGGVPSDKGYRYYVESLGPELELSPAEELSLRHQFRQAERDLERWTRLAVAILAQMARNLAIATVPRPAETRFRRVELVSLQEFLTLLVLVLQEARLKKQVLPLERPATQDELTQVANKLNALYSGLSRYEVQAKEVELTPLEGQVRAETLRLMWTSEHQEMEEACTDGLRHLLAQPEFRRGEGVQDLVEALESGQLVRYILPEVAGAGHGVRVVIGAENRHQVLRPFSIVMATYGLRHEREGAVLVVGPTRMAYDRAISAVRNLSQVMDDLAAEVG